MTTLEFKHAAKSFGSVDVLTDFNLSLRDRELAVLVGPSGSGKSTVLRMIAGLETLTSGELLIDGIRANEMEPAAREVAMLFQSCALYPHMSVAGNIGFALRMSGCSKAEVSERVCDAAKVLQITALLDRRPSELSGGQRQRVAIGRAIVRRPKVFLFDEPLSSLDADLRIGLRRELAKLHRRLGATTVYVTHDQSEAMTLADRIVVLRSGRIEQIGEPRALYERPANRFVAEFIGSPKMNFFLGTVIAGLHGPRIACLRDQFLDLPPLVGELEIGATVRIGVRPEHLDFDGPDALTFRVSVEFVEDLGSTSYVHATAPSGESVTVEYRRGPTPALRTELALSFSPRRAHLFASSGVRLNGWGDATGR